MSVIKPNNRLAERVRFVEKTLQTRIISISDYERLCALTDEEVKLPEDIKQLWIESMRVSFKTTGTLERVRGTETRQCCLGNLCRVAQVAGVTVPTGLVTTGLVDEHKVTFGENATISFLPGEVAVWCHMVDCVQQTLAGFNDGPYQEDKDFHNMILLVEQYL